jgi:hypothetical protein
VPGSVASANNDDDWLNLSEPSIPDLRPETPKLHAPTFTEPGARPVKPASARAHKPSAPSKPVAAQGDGDPDDIRLLAEEPLVHHRPLADKELKDLSKELDSIIDARQSKLEETVDEKMKRSVKEDWEMQPLKGRMAQVVDEDHLAEFRFPCKYCSTVMYANIRKVGTSTKCPDCQSELVIPKPHVGWDKKKAIAQKKKELAQRERYRQEQKEESLTPSVMDKSVQDTLARARAAVEEEEAEHKELVYDFDTRGWLARTFGLFTDPTLLVFGCSASLLLGLIFLGSSTMTSLSESTGGRIFALQLVMIFGLGGPIMGITLANSLAILQSAANQLRRVPEWPLSNPGDWWEDSLCAIVSVLLAALPGGLLGWVLRSLGVHSLLSMGVTLMSIWFLAPPILLSILDNQSIFEPFSTNVFKSYRLKADSWMGMYVLTGASAMFLFLMLVLAFSGNLVGSFLAGAVLPFVCFFMFQQIGMLGARISDVTTLVFDPPASTKTTET